jgi:TolB-like protein
MLRNNLFKLALVVVICPGIIAGLIFAYFVFGRSPTRKPQFKSLAVLPLKPMAPEAPDPALELGMTDGLINKLSTIRQITVRPTNSVLKYSQKEIDLRVAAKELEVDVVLDGKVQKIGDRVRLSLQLVRASDGAPIWGENFDESFTDVLALQDRVSQRVASALSPKLSDDK